MKIFTLQGVSIPENELFYLNNISSWYLMTISKSDPPEMNIYFCRFLVFGKFSSRIIMILAILTRMNSKALILHVINSMTMLVVRNMT